jgi:hypothetical protein
MFKNKYFLLRYDIIKNNCFFSKDQFEHEDLYYWLRHATFIFYINPIRKCNKM